MASSNPAMNMSSPSSVSPENHHTLRRRCDEERDDRARETIFFTDGAENRSVLPALDFALLSEPYVARSWIPHPGRLGCRRRRRKEAQGKSKT